MNHKTVKKCMAVLLALAMILSAVPLIALASSSPFAGGDGSSVSPYQVADEAQLEAIRSYLGSCFIQVNDITLTSSNWTPIGNAGVGNRFTGSYNGGGYKIKGLKINITTPLDSSTMQGLFGVVGLGGVIRNVNLENVDIDVAASTGTYESFVGGLAGESLGTISDCSVTGTLDAAAYDIAAGGLVGSVGGSQQIGSGAGTVTGCTSACILNIACTYQTAHAGGLVGEIFTTGSSVSNCTSSGTVTCRGDSDTNQTGPTAGGLIGYAGGGTESGIEINNCSSDSAVYAISARSQANAGGLIGCVSGKCIISGCSSTGNAEAGGSTGAAGVQVDAGGLIGWSSASSSVITNCHCSGNATASGTGTTSYDDFYSGGFLGYSSSGTTSISQCYAMGSATTSANTYGYAFAGGFGGYLTNANVDKCYSKGNAQAVSAEGYASAGGFTGYYKGTGTMQNCFSTGNASADCVSRERAGGLSGVVESASVSHCYSTGIPGVAHLTYLPQCGGLVGVNNAGTISGSFYDSTVSGMTDTGKGTPMASADMKNPDFVVSLAGTGWKLVSNLNGGYPVLDGVGLGTTPTASVSYKDSADTSTVYGTDTVAQGAVFSQPGWVSPSKAGSSLTGWYTDPSCDSSLKWDFSARTVSGTAQTLFAGWEAAGDLAAPGISNGALSVSSVTQTGLTLSWNKAADTVSAQPALEYLVYYSGRNNLGSVPNIEANGTAIGSYDTDISTKEVTGLAAGTTYYFNVIVKDEAGNKACYTTKSAATTLASGAAAYDTNLVANGNAEASDTVMVGWTASGPVFTVWTPADIIPNPPSSNGGNVFDFFPPVTSAESLCQIIDISNLDSDIDAGLVNIQAGAEARKYMAASVDMLKLELLNASGDVLETYTASGTTENSDSSWQNLLISVKAIDSGTRKLRLTLVAQISDAAPNSDYIEFDGVSLILSRTPVLTAGSVNRASDTNATVAFTSDKAGQYYYVVANDGVLPALPNTGVAGISCPAGETSIALAALTAGAKDIYILVKDASDNVSSAIKIDIPAYTASDLIKPVLTAGSVSRTSDANAMVSFSTDEAGQYYYGVVNDGDAEPALATVDSGITCSVGNVTITLGTLTTGAKDIYIKVKDAAGNVSTALVIDIPAFTAPDHTAPTLTAGAVNRTGITNATAAFTSDEAGEYYYGIVDDGGTAPQIDTTIAGVTCLSGETVIPLASLTLGAKDIYIKVKDAAGNVSTALKMDIPDAFIPVTGILNVPVSAAQGVDLTLSGTVDPSEATNQTIAWSLKNAGATGATLSGTTLSTVSEGTVTVTATIVCGASPTADFTQDFTIPVYIMSHNTLQEQVDTTTVLAEGLIADAAQLIVMPIADGDEDRAELEQQLTEQSAIAAYEVHMEPEEAFRPPLTLTFQVGQAYNGRTVYILHMLSDGSTDVYTPTVTNGQAVITVNELSPFLLAVDPQVTITAQPQSALALAGQTAVFHVAAEGLDPLSYRWQRRVNAGASWEDIPGATEPGYTTTALNRSHDGYQYRVIVTDVLGNSATSDTAVLTVTESPDTGDTSRPLAYAAMTVLFAAVVIFIMRKRRKA